MLTCSEWVDLGLTETQAKIADMVCSGFKNTDIAAKRGTTNSAVSQVITAINLKIGTKRRIEIILFSIEESNRRSVEAADRAMRTDHTPAVEDHPLAILPAGR